ncbi:MAG: hypothetical protein N2572_04465 [Syntrophales bacterium]|nr:hypothetical protein [Syntrophales bacterium]
MLTYSNIKILLDEDDVINFCLFELDLDKEEMQNKYGELMGMIAEGYIIIITDAEIKPLEAGLPLPMQEDFSEIKNGVCLSFSKTNPIA